MELQEAILKRRSVRKFTEYYVSDDEIKQIIEAGRWAPSWSNTQISEFVIVRDKSLIEKVAATYAPGNPATKGTLTASAVIVACAKKGESGVKVGLELTKYNNWFMFDVALAVQNICLKAHELGLGTVIVGLINHDACKQVLKLPENYEVVVAIPIGKPLVAGKDGPPRKELASMIHLDTFGKPFIV